MKKIVLLFFIICLFIFSCDDNKTSHSSKESDSTATTTTVSSPDSLLVTPPDGADEPTDSIPAPPPPSAALPKVEMTPSLHGSWVLEYVSGNKIAFDGLYPDNKPTILFDVANKKISGNTSCNNFTGTLKSDSNRINFTEPFAMTKKMCPGQGEQTFLSAIKKVNRYSISDDKLTFIMGDIAVMRFRRQ